MKTGEKHYPVKLLRQWKIDDEGGKGGSGAELAKLGAYR